MATTSKKTTGKLCRLKNKTRENWLKTRYEVNGVGASDAACVVGESPWKSASDFWKEKITGTRPKDISDDPFVQQGIRMEPALRTLYKAKHPEYSVRHEPYDIWYRAGREWMFATLDGRIIDKANKKKGILEIKTSTPNGKTGWAKWDNQIPRNYYLQCLHACTILDYDFIVLYAALINRDDDMTIREYRFEREDIQADMDWLLKKETEFWNSVQNRSIPPMTLVF